MVQLVVFPLGKNYTVTSTKGRAGKREPNGTADRGQGWSKWRTEHTAWPTGSTIWNREGEDDAKVVLHQQQISGCSQSTKQKGLVLLLLFIFLLGLVIFILGAWVICLQVCLCTNMYLLPTEIIRNRIPGNETMDGCESTCGCWEWNPGPSEEQSEPSRQPRCFPFTLRMLGLNLGPLALLMWNHLSRAPPHFFYDRVSYKIGVKKLTALLVFLSLHPMYWDCRHAPPDLFNVVLGMDTSVTRRALYHLSHTPAHISEPFCPHCLIFPGARTQLLQPFPCC